MVTVTGLMEILDGSVGRRSEVTLLGWSGGIEGGIIVENAQWTGQKSQFMVVSMPNIVSPATLIRWC